jgi:hypothetical protein
VGDDGVEHSAKNNLLTMKEMAGGGEETEMSSLYIVTRIS